MYHDPIFIIKSSEGNSFLLELCPEHRIFSAHFPEKPVLPGACIIEIFNHLVGVIKGSALNLEHIRQIKFLKMIDPVITRRVRFIFDSIVNEDGHLTVKASLQSEDGQLLFAKISASYAIR